MVLTGGKLRRRKWTYTTDRLIEKLESPYENEPNMFSIRIHRYPGRRYVDGHIDIFDMVGIDLFSVVALNMMVLQLGYTGSGIDSSGLSHDKSFEVDDLDLNLNEPDVSRTQEHVVQQVIVKDYASSEEDDKHSNGQEAVEAPNASTDNNDDEDDDFMVDEENEIVEPSVDVHFFGISMDVPFANIGTPNLVPNDVLEGEDVDAVNPDSFDNDMGYDNEISNYMRRRKLLVQKRLRIESSCISLKAEECTGPTGLNQGMGVGPSGSNGPSTRSKRRKNTGKSNAALINSWQRSFHSLELHVSMIKAFIAKAKSKREIKGDHGVSENICLFGSIKTMFRTCKRELLGLDGAFMKGPFPGIVLVAVGLDSNNGIYPLTYALVEAEKHRFCLRRIHENMKYRWCGQAYKDLLWRSASATTVKEFQKCRAKYDLLLNNICKVFNGKIVGGGDKPDITLLNYIKEYCIKRIVNVQSVIDKCTGPLTPTSTRIMDSIKKEALLMKVQWNGGIKYQVSVSFGDQCIVNVMARTCSCRKWKLTGILCKHVVAACWNMTLNDRATPPPQAWVNPCYWLTTWRETYSHKTKEENKEVKHEDEPFVKDGGNNAEASGSASGKAQQAEPAVGQDGSGGSCVGAVIGLSAAGGQDGSGGAGVGVGSQGSSHSRWTNVTSRQ
ncbi:hypothetical protein Tco_1465874 [Tanacetum coccineum]